MKVGRKATIGGAVILIMSYFIQAGMVSGIDLWIVLGIIAVTCWFYMFINYKQKTILPPEVELNGTTEIVDSEKYNISIGNIRTLLNGLEKRVDDLSATVSILSDDEGGG